MEVENIRFERLHKPMPSWPRSSTRPVAAGVDCAHAPCTRNVQKPRVKKKSYDFYINYYSIVSSTRSVIQKSLVKK